MAVQISAHLTSCKCNYQPAIHHFIGFIPPHRGALSILQIPTNFCWIAFGFASWGAIIATIGVLSKRIGGRQ
jgi:hypothetical protein